MFHKHTKATRGEPGRGPEGTFRCDVCRFVQPEAGLCGDVADTAENPPRIYKLCGCCSLWLGLGTSRFQKGLLFTFSDKQLAKIKALDQELDSLGSFDGISKKISDLAQESNLGLQKMGNLEESFQMAHESLSRDPVLRSLTKFRFSILSSDYRDLSDRLTRGLKVDRREINKANK